jgi:hypothetical protein
MSALLRQFFKHGGSYPVVVFTLLVDPQLGDFVLASPFQNQNILVKPDAQLIRVMLYDTQLIRVML